MDDDDDDDYGDTSIDLHPLGPPAGRFDLNSLRAGCGCDKIEKESEDPRRRRR